MDLVRPDRSLPPVLLLLVLLIPASCKLESCAAAEFVNSTSSRGMTRYLGRPKETAS